MHCHGRETKATRAGKRWKVEEKRFVYSTARRRSDQPEAFLVPQKVFCPQRNLGAAVHKAVKVQIGGYAVPHPHVLGHTTTRCHVHCGPVSSWWCGRSRVHPWECWRTRATHDMATKTAVFFCVSGVSSSGSHVISFWEVCT